MGGVILKIISKWTDSTTNARYGHVAIWTLIILWIKELTTKKQVNCSCIYCTIKWLISFT